MDCMGQKWVSGQGLVGGHRVDEWPEGGCRVVGRPAGVDEWSEVGERADFGAGLRFGVEDGEEDFHSRNVGRPGFQS